MNEIEQKYLTLTLHVFKQFLIYTSQAEDKKQNFINNPVHAA